MIVRPLTPSAATGPAVPTRRVPVAFGNRFFMLLGAGVLLVIPAFLDARAAWVLAAWNILVLALWAVDLRQIPSGADLEVTRRWRSPLALGVHSDVSLELRNHSGIPLSVDVIDDVPSALRRDMPALRTGVDPASTSSINYEVLPAERGDVTAGALSLRVRSPWAIAERWLTVDAPQKVRVFPDLAEARQTSLFLLRNRQVSLEKRRARVTGLGRDFESLRDYQPGDEPRDICWTVTARRGRPVTRVYQPERSQAIWIMVDGGRLLRTRAGDRTKLDAMVDAALGLSQVALASGDRVGIVTYGRRIHARLPPGRGSQHLRAIVDALATVPAERAEADHAAAVASVMASQKRRALIVWLTDVAETADVPDVIESASRLAPRHVVLFGVMRQPELAAVAEDVPANEDGMYHMLAVHEMLERREVLLRGLRQRGVLVLELAEGAPAAPLIAQYLGVKQRNLI